MGDHPIAATYRKAYEDFTGGDAAGFVGMLAEDVVWHQIGAETLHGAKAVEASMSGMAEAEFDLDLHDVLANDDHLLALVTAKVSIGNESIEYRTVEIAHFDEAGRVTERWAFSDDTQAIADFFGQF